VLASDEERGSLDALRFSLASDIVELVVLTCDEAFLQTLREAVGSARRLWHVPSGDKVSDLLVAGEVGILVLDVHTLSEAPDVFIAQIKRQFPDLVVVVAGNRDAETSLAALISAGVVYRFIHKPMSPGRAKLFADAAVKKFDEQRRRTPTPPIHRKTKSNPALIVGGTIGALALLAAVLIMYKGAEAPSGEAPSGASRTAGLPRPPAAESPLLISAAAALAANRLTDPPGDNALELYLQAQVRKPADPIARAGIAEVRERLLARAENALLEERLDEAASAIETARKSGVESGRIAFLSAQLGKSRDQVKAAQASARVRNAPKAETNPVSPLLDLAAQRNEDGHLIEPAQDSALFYVKEALRLDPGSGAVQEAEQALAMHLLTEARGAVDRRDFARATALLDAAKGVAAAPNIETLESLLAAARRQADSDAWSQLLKNATERLQQDRLIEPPNDSAKYYLTTLRSLDPNNSGLAAATSDLGTRLVIKARRALTLAQYDAVRSWLDEAGSIGFTSPESASVKRDLDTSIAQQQFLDHIVAAGELTLVKSVTPKYPQKAELHKVQGWVELDFTVAESGAVKDVVVRATDPPGVFEDAAIGALAQWRYQPVLRDSKPVPQRARIRIRFTLAG
jgi:TonB family protein